MSNNGLAPLAGPQSIAGADLKQQRDTSGENQSSALALGSTPAVSMLKPTSRCRWAGQGFLQAGGWLPEAAWQQGPTLSS